MDHPMHYKVPVLQLHVTKDNPTSNVQSRKVVGINLGGGGGLRALCLAQPRAGEFEREEQQVAQHLAAIVS